MAIPQERLDILRFQVENQGLTPSHYQSLKKTNDLTDLPNAPMIMISQWELRQLLDAYEETEK